MQWKVRFFSILIIAIFTFINSSFASVSTKNQWTVEKVMQVKSIADLTFSPNNLHLLFSVNQSNLKKKY